MKNIKVILITLLLLLMCESVFASHNGYVVKFKDGFVPDNISFKEVNSAIGLYVVDSKDVLKPFENQIEYVEENGEVELIGELEEFFLLTIPDDEYYNEQWQLQMVSADYVWDFETYGNGINVAVIDTGCNMHEELKDNLKGGFNYLTNEVEYRDNDGHGTHVSGIIAAAHNSIGVAGVAPKVNIYALKCVDAGYTTTVGMLAQAIVDAVDVYNCKVINMSLGTPVDYTFIYDAVKYAYNKGAVIVAAVGNTNKQGFNYYYPAGYNEVIGVGSVDIYKNVSSFSLKNNSVFVVAPGESFKSLKGTSDYTYKKGTSQATPVVAGAIALMLSADNTLHTNDIKRIISETSEDLGTAGYDYSYGYGLLNIPLMFRKVIQRVPYYVSPINDGEVLIFNNTTGPMQGVGVFAQYDDKKHYVGCSITDVLLMSGKKSKIKVPFKENSKFFLWYSMESAYPLSETRMSK